MERLQLKYTSFVSILKLVLQTLKRAGFSISIVSAGLIYQYIKLKHLTNLSTQQILSRMGLIKINMIF